MPRVTMNGAQVVEVLLALGDGESVLVGVEDWTSLEECGFEVNDYFGTGASRIVPRDSLKALFAVATEYQVLR